MIQTFTQDDVIRYVYEETDPTESQCIEDALLADDELMAAFLDAAELRAQLNRAERQPREATIQNILSYSRHYVALT